MNALALSPSESPVELALLPAATTDVESPVRRESGLSKILLCTVLSLGILVAPAQAGWIQKFKQHVKEHPWVFAAEVVATVAFTAGTFGVGDGVVLLLVGGGDALAAANGATAITITAANVMGAGGAVADVSLTVHEISQEPGH